MPVRLALLIVAAALFAACGSTGATPVPEGALMAAQSRGGMCREGTCETTIYVERDGLVHAGANSPNALGMLSAETVAELEAQIAAADFDEIRSHPFTGDCPTAFDGQELVFEFQTSHGVERIESCQTAVDYESPLFSAVVAAVGEYFFIGVDDGPVPPQPEPPPLPVR